MIRIDNLMDKVQEYAPAGADLEILSKAYVYSAQLHSEKYTQAGTPTIRHALEVSYSLAEFKLDIDCIVAGLLYDVLAEDLADKASLENMVGHEVALLVEDIAKLSKATFQGSAATRAEHMRQMILASTRDLRVVLILLADRLQYLRSADGIKEETRRAMARETQAIYAPIAHRLGIHFIKAEMEDLAFKVLEPDAYYDLQNAVERRVSQRKIRIQRINQEMSDLLEKNRISGEVLGRTKNLYSLREKMRRDKLELDRIYDLLATRIIVDSEEHCYRLLGLIHASYTPLPGRFKDYIALPKPNGYQSLHTCVFGEEGDIFEIQLRTKEMHRQAELGIAAHFVYKDGEHADERELANVAWFRQLVENLETGQDPQESMDSITEALQTEQIFVLTPAGEVIKLSRGATPIDFAYAIHSQVGNHCTGARVDGRMLSIRTPLENGTTVEILTAKNQSPSKDWLNFAVSSKAQNRIRSFLRQKERAEHIDLGQEIVNREARRLSKKVDQMLAGEEIRDWMHRSGMSSLDELFAAVGAEKINFRDVLEKLFPQQDSKPTQEPQAKKTIAPPKKPSSQKRGPLVSVAGLDNMMVRFAKCCTPIAGKPIKGIITRGRGISIHRPDCHNLSDQMYEEGRVVPAEWLHHDPVGEAVEIVVRTMLSSLELDKTIRKIEREEGIALLVGKGKPNKSESTTRHITAQIADSGQLERVLSKLNSHKNIHAVRVLESA